MKSSFVFGFILIILLIIGVLVGLPYAIKELKSGSFSLPFFPKILTKPASNYFYHQPPSATTTPIPQQAVKKISISSVSRYGQGEISLRALYFDSGKINITGWKIKSIQRGETIIGKGINLPQFDAAPSDIWLSSGERADIIVGLSPLAVNFRVNNCFGWLNNLYNLGYSLNYCPGGFRLGDLTGLDSACQDLILRAGSCRTPSENDLNKASYKCRQWAEKNMTYNACVAGHKNDSDFYKGWKIYTGNGNKIFDSLHDVIELRDQNGLLIDSYEY
ncbi:MAG: hypothetical protein HYV51_02220 [Parcubacteria group bacterium]|nr:hypothetical protein [Parcubacteria group bacterium]